MDDINVYRKLQRHLNKMPVGFPATKSGLELQILKFVFTPEEAQIATKLKYQPEPLKIIYRRIKKTGISMEDLEQKLDKMYKKGEINFGKKVKGEKEIKYYFIAPFAIGFYEYQLNRMTKEFAQNARQYIETSFVKDEYNKTGIPQLRIIPIERSIDYEQSISNFDDFRSMIENVGEPIAIANCICRQSMDLLDKPCEKTCLRESCFSFRAAAKLYIDQGFARKITKDEALDILKKAEEDGLVIQSGNSQKPFVICTCCGCCCQILVSEKKLIEPAQFFATNYYAKVNPDLCEGCGICEKRCSMEAIQVIDNISHVNKTRCIGCGVCVTTCTAKAIKIHKKKDEIIPPKNTIATYNAIMEKKAELARDKT
ncbi:MAG: 4Fe-4S binding protein [Promethearchaeota archaeon]